MIFLILATGNLHCADRLTILSVVSDRVADKVGRIEARGDEVREIRDMCRKRRITVRRVFTLETCSCSDVPPKQMLRPKENRHTKSYLWQERSFDACSPAKHESRIKLEASLDSW